MMIEDLKQQAFFTEAVEIDEDCIEVRLHLMVDRQTYRKLCLALAEEGDRRAAELEA